MRHKCHDNNSNSYLIRESNRMLLSLQMKIDKLSTTRSPTKNCFRLNSR